MNAKKWLSIWSFIIFIIPITGLINFLVSPLSNNGLIDNEYKERDNERYYQYNKIFNSSKKHYDGFIIGSSKVMSISPNRNYLISNYYNLWSSVLLNNEKSFLLDNILINYKPKTIIIGIDFFNFNSYIDNEHNFKKKLLQYQKEKNDSFFSLRQLQLSFRTIKNYIYDKKQSIFQDDGTLLSLGTERKINDGTFDFSDSRYRERINKRFNTYFNNFEYNYDAIDTYIEMKKKCSKNQIECRFVLLPIHAFALEKIKKDKKLNKYYEMMLNDLRTNLSFFFNLQTFNSFSHNNKLWYDGWHYRSVVGDEVIKCIFENKCILMQENNKDNQSLVRKNKI